MIINKNKIFIEKAIIIHGDKYDYSKIEYIRSDKNVIIVCKIHGDFTQTPNNHLSNRGCYECGKKALATKLSKPTKGHSLLDEYPNICQEWDSSNIKKPTEFKSGSNIKVFWKCSKCDLKYSMTPCDRVKGRACPKCRYVTVAKKNSTPKPGNSIEDLFPELCKEWSVENKTLPKNCRPHSRRRVWWDCDKCHYRWESSVVQRTWHNTGCPKCSFKEMGERYSVIKSNNNLLTLHPELCLEWSNKNERPPESYGESSGLSVYWLCSICGHEWKAKVYSRSRNGNGCPKCRASHGEKSIRRFLLEEGILFEEQHRILDCKNKRPLPFDFAIYTNRLKLIEYQGRQHYEKHTQWGQGKLDFIKLSDSIKSKYCSDNNIPLLVIPYWDLHKLDFILEEFVLEEP